MFHPKTDVSFPIVRLDGIILKSNSGTPLMFHNKGEADDFIYKSLHACLGVFFLLYCAVSPNF